MSNCDCSIDIDGCGPLAFTEEIRQARKTHRCVECNDIIDVGDYYEYVSGVWENGPASYKTCLTCVQIREDYCRYGHRFGQLDSHLKECLGVEL